MGDMLPDPHANKPSSPRPATPITSADPCRVETGSGETLYLFPNPVPADQTLSKLTVDQRSRMLRNLQTVGLVVEGFAEDLISSVIKPLQDVSPDLLASQKDLALLIQNARDRLVERGLQFEFDIGDFTSLTELIQDYATAVKTEIATVLQMMSQLAEGSGGTEPKKSLNDILIRLYRITSLDTNALTPVLLKKIGELTTRDSVA